MKLLKLYEHLNLNNVLLLIKQTEMTKFLVIMKLSDYQITYGNAKATISLL